MNTRSCLLVAVLVAFCSLLPSAAFAAREVEEVEEKSYELNSGATVKVSVDKGYIKVQTWDRAEVHLVITKRARGKDKREAKERLEEISVRLDHDRDLLHIRERELDDRSYSIFDLLDPDTWNDLGGRIMWVDIDLTVPENTNLVLDTDEGDITISQLGGEIEVNTDEGVIELRRIRSDQISLTSDEGDIILERIEPQKVDARGRLDIDCDEGGIELTDITIDRVKIETDEGDVVGDMLRCRYLDFFSDEGSIDVDLELFEGGDYRCRTDEGDVVLFFDKDASFDITARTQEGSILSEFPLDVRESGDGERVDDMVNGGGCELYLFTEEGNIRLREK